MTGTRVVGFGHFQPARVVTNAEMETIVETSDEWIQRRVGIKERRWASEDETVEVMATKAAQDALAKANMNASQIDMIILASCTTFDHSPNVASRVALALEMTNDPVALDINTACSGFTHGVALASQAIAAGSNETVMVIGVDKLTDVTDFTDRSTVVLTADGAGAAILTAADEQGVSPVVWGAIPQMGSAVRIERKNNDKFAQEGQAVYRWATSELPKIAKQIVEKAGLTPDDLAAIVLHQANLRIIEPLARKIGAPNAIVATDVVYSGNTSAASVPLALSKLLEEHPLPSGAPILMFAFGGGLSYAGQVIKAP
ncbi:3-oxoacyl-[acyl-carrier-protein] synthase-3 [Antricoccus suffuscus]|uniref:Beta-ketoacyl-[acyl-carrier-protein] synthase III n=1 Tax=Antricoccus suffuscus TaxID=1629062 RepID=A0A2T0ZRW5_9ACTN|nr:beta-ketoacyl-ACP synthase III [Antricoccus suffuscus]PRZ39102.1 3-oxoacyl-[acyl-carrier-protein] synthase-3 [Antricoccus suffuscus]